MTLDYNILTWLLSNTYSENDRNASSITKITDKIEGAILCHCFNKHLEYVLHILTILFTNKFKPYFLLTVLSVIIPDEKLAEYKIA